MNLSELNIGENAEIIKIKGRGAFRRKVMEMGIVVGEKISAIRKAPFNDPVEYEVKGYKIILRKAEASLIEISTDFSANVLNSLFETVILEKENQGISVNKKKICIGLIGNCTSGKTTIFNYLTGLDERVGNYEGVTVEVKKHTINFQSYEIVLYDMPGVYSLSGNSSQKKQIRDFLYTVLPDVIINVVDATNLERNLFLSTDLIDSDMKVIMALNMWDDFEKKGNKLDFIALGNITGVPVVPITASRGKGIDQLIEKSIEVYNDEDRQQRHVHIHYGEQLEVSLKNIQSVIKTEFNIEMTNRLSSRFLALKLLQNDPLSEERISECVNHEEITQHVSREKERIERLYKINSEQLITDYKFGFINGALKETLQLPAENQKNSDSIDSVLTHKVFGLPIFFFFMWIMFSATFSLGSYPMQWIENLVSLVSGLLRNNMEDGMLKDLLVDGVLSGVGGVLVFLPNILILYFFISLMEETGYMSRAVFIMDKIMHKFGLHGKSFIPLIMGFGCNVPAILASRMLENRKERLITILINPFISCNARLPVYILFTTAFFPNHSGTVFFLIYLTGIVVAIITSLILKRFILREHDQPFVMELPPYRTPLGKVILRNMWRKSSQYIRKIGGVILIASVIFWALSYFPHQSEDSNNFTKEISQLEHQKNELSKKEIIATSPANEDINQIQLKIDSLALLNKSEQKERSYLGRIGHFIEPVIRPLGFDWRIGISIISGIPAKEIIISTMSVLYQVDNERDMDNKTLVTRIQAQTYKYGEKMGEKVFNPIVALSFMIFVLLYIPCIGTISAIKKETGSWKWSFFSVVYSFSLAWILSFIIYQVGSRIF